MITAAAVIQTGICFAFFSPSVYKYLSGHQMHEIEVCINDVPVNQKTFLDEVMHDIQSKSNKHYFTL